MDTGNTDVRGDLPMGDERDGVARRGDAPTTRPDPQPSRDPEAVEEQMEDSKGG